jgi:2-(1,2-epoxy-1,2-dihydrophenyl)acetyl-CoA isomerase
LDTFEKTWRELAAQLAAGPTLAFALTKKLLYSAADRTLDEQLDLEVDAQTEAGRSHDHLEGVQSFFDKRSPKFEGR